MGQVNFSVYITTQNLEKYGANADTLTEMIGNVKDIGANKVFLESWRGGKLTDKTIHKHVRDAFVEAGIEVATGIMPVRGGDVSLLDTDDFGFKKDIGGNSRWASDICYSRPWSREVLREAMRQGAELFDEYIIDDAFCTQCTCVYCRAQRGDRTWDEFRRDQLLEVAREDIVGACREVNPDIKMILKFPQWYDRLKNFGYDTATEPGEFDATWIGTETRDPDTAQFGFVPQYEACFNVRWHKNSSPNLEGCWFDFYDCDKTIYVEQAYQSVLGGARNLTLFCYASGLFLDAKDDYLGNLKKHTPNLQKIADATECEPVGVTVVRPHNPVPREDHYIYDSFGMCGFPLVPVADWPEETPKSLLVTAHNTDDDQLTAKVADVVDAGGTVFITAAAMAERDDDEELKKLAGYQQNGWVERRRWECDIIVLDDREFTYDETIEWRFDLQPQTAEILVGTRGMGHHGPDTRIPIVTRQEHASGGAVVVLNVYGASPEDFPMSESLNVPVELVMQKLPPVVLNIIQEQVAKAVGRAIIAPARVGFYPFENGTIVLQNFRDVPICAKIAGEDLPEGVKDQLGNAEVMRGDGATGVYLPPRSAALLR